VSYDLAVVGAGFSAIAVTINAMRSFPPSSRIAVIGDDASFGRGTAYRTEFYVHRLNVPAGRMSVFADKPDDFVEWLTSKGRDPSVDDFASRNDYGLYLRDRLAALLRDRANCAKVDFIKSKAAGCVRSGDDGIVFTLDNDEHVTARTVALCLGVGNARLPPALQAAPQPVRSRIIENPWKLDWLQRVGHTDTVCILGTGLTMIDQILALRTHGHRGKIHAVSRRGLIPHPHLAKRSHPIPPVLPEEGRAVSEILAALRRQADSTGDWRAVIDGLRPHTQALWQEMTMDQRGRFLRHALPWWNIHRHRIAPGVFQQFEALISAGVVKVHAGYIDGIEHSGNQLALSFRRRGSSEIDSLDVDWIVNSTGMERAGIDHSPLLQEMLRQGLIQQDPLGLGIIVDKASRTINGEGKASAGLYAVGALTAGQFWEITAVPDIRTQAAGIAAGLTSTICGEPPERGLARVG
jgi:uncharacterized NAD(P)/FAD-binding protein YdhS